MIEDKKFFRRKKNIQPRFLTSNICSVYQAIFTARMISTTNAWNRYDSSRAETIEITRCLNLQYCLALLNNTTDSYPSCTLDNVLNEPWELIKRPSCPRWTITNLLNTSAKPLSAKDVNSFSTSTVELRRSVTSKTFGPPQMLAESRAASIKEDTI